MNIFYELNYEEIEESVRFMSNALLLKKIEKNLFNRAKIL